MGVVKFMCHPHGIFFQKEAHQPAIGRRDRRAVHAVLRHDRGHLGDRHVRSERAGTRAHGTLDRLRSVAVRRWEIEFARPPADDEFRRIVGVRQTDITGNRLQIAFEGSANEIVKMAARHEVIDIGTRDGDLEEIFLRYYQDDEHDDDGIES
jgi:ABC-2 type transport system ATP-binding protein